MVEWPVRRDGLGESMLFKFLRMLGPFLIVSSLAQGQKTVTTSGGTVNVVPKYSGTATLVNSPFSKAVERWASEQERPRQLLPSMAV
jgi:hypothetical protein